MSIELSANGVALTLSPPNEGYQMEVDCEWIIQKSSDGSVSVFDCGTSYDRYSCEIETILSASATEALLLWLSDSTKGRGVGATMTLSTGSGFYPFTPYRADEGAFTVAVELLATPQMLTDIPGYFSVRLRLTNAGTWPSHTPDAAVSEGPMAIGTVTELACPRNLFEPSAVYRTEAVITGGTTARYEDRTSQADYFQSTFSITCGTGKCAALLTYLLGTRRASGGSLTAFNVVAPTGFYMFGGDQGSDGTYSCQLLSRQIQVFRENYNLYTIKLPLQRVG